MHDLLTGLLERARQRAATEADAYLVDEQHSSVQVRLGKVETVTHSREQRLALRVFSGKASASASTSDLSRESVERLVDEAVALARLTAPDPVAGLPDPGEFAPAIPDLGLEDPEGHGLTPEEKIAIAQRAETAALEVDPRITNSEGAEFFERRARYAYATSHGFFGSYPTSSFGLTVSPVASANGEMQRDSWYTFARKRARLEAPEEVGRIAAQRALRRLGARQIKTAQVPVLFDPETAASLLRALAGAASGPGLYRGASFLLNRLGTRIAALGVTIVDSGIIPGALGSRPFDGEGLPIRKTVLVNAGTLESYLLDTYSGRKLGLPSTHHASRDGGGVGVATTNLYLAAGEAPPQELIGAVKRGLYVTELIGFGVNMVTGDYSRGAVGHWIENGELAYPVEEVTVAGNLLQMFQAIDGIGNDLVLRDRTSAPTLRLARMVVAGN
ncbi:MAG: TldD/PmbA family protein [Candidatus Rokubacteria bacterium]|nr:TldD/PmbA family protein [Candidatus Rokubacteria bacterium]